LNILISNDDGVYSPALKSLADMASQFGQVTVVAPDRDRSGASNALTLDNPIRVKRLENGYYSVEGTPTDCVHTAIAGGLHIKADLLLSGLNTGANLGDDVLYSGTVAAAREGRLLRLNAMAFSMAAHRHFEPIYHFETGIWAAEKLIKHYLANIPMAYTLLNVNIPDLPISEIKGFKVTRLGSRHAAETVITARDPRGREAYWVGPAAAGREDEPDTDFAAIREGYVSVTPLLIDLTQYAAIPELTHWLDISTVSDATP